MKDLTIITKDDFKYKSLMKKEFLAAISAARQSSCYRARCGTSIFDNRGKITNIGYNHPPSNLYCRCGVDKNKYSVKVTDKTCCIHAEQHAIMYCDDMKRLIGSTLFFTRIDENDNIIPSGEPYCTLCSKMALDAGIEFFVLWHGEDKGFYFYPTEYYNQLSYEYKE